jgi:hypothetical protein
MHHLSICHQLLVNAFLQAVHHIISSLRKFSWLQLREELLATMWLASMVAAICTIYQIQFVAFDQMIITLNHKSKENCNFSNNEDVGI